ncbi:hypothetical protein WJX73_010467 [Symbiochloris irregularis]|uniref:Ammonium transporter n=1 Tax=Symbiochloris irregularis TaxID=706552 RepID=A0AAW1PHW5_9CHLO
MSSAVPPAPGAVYTPGNDLSNADLYTIADSVTAATGFQSTQYADLTAAFVLNSAYLVFFMHCGFAMISVGCVRTRFAKHIAILILADAAASAFGYYFTGYAFAFGDNLDASGAPNGNYFIGTNYFALHALPHTGTSNSDYLWVFQWSFAATACTIVSGAIAERARFESYLLYSVFMAGWVYPIVTHSVWSPMGWAGMLRNTTYAPHRLLGVGAIDFAGSGAVHMVGGCAAAAGCFMIGPRIGRYLPDGTVVDMPGHNSSLFVLGVMILWFGWYGFNPGSQLALVGYSGAIANAAITTTLAPAFASLSALAVKSTINRVSTGRWSYDIMTMGNGALAGLVAITASCSTVYPWGAIVIGIVAGMVYNFGSWVSVKLHLDDPLDAIAVHAWNGGVGVIAPGFIASQGLIQQSYGFANTDNDCTQDPTNSSTNNCPFRQYGCFLGGNGDLLGAQIIYFCWIVGWVLGNMLPFFFILKILGILRVPAEEETLGIDESYHGGHAYPGHGAEYDSSMSKSNGNANGKSNGNFGNNDNSDLTSIKSELAELRATLKSFEHEHPRPQK